MSTSAFANKSNVIGLPTGAANDRPKAQIWANVGRVMAGTDADGNAEEIFVSTGGFALDTITPFDVKKVTSPKMRILRDTQNKMHDDLMSEVASQLAPGESVIVNLQVQILRVKEDAVAPTADENTLYQKSSFIG